MGASPHPTIYLKKYVDYTIIRYTDNTNAGTGTIDISFTSTGNFEGLVHKQFTISPRVFDGNYFITTVDHSGLTSRTETIAAQEYTSKPITLSEIYVYYEQVVEGNTYTYTLLTENVDYKLNYINNTNVGKVDEFRLSLFRSSISSGACGYC